MPTKARRSAKLRVVESLELPAGWRMRAGVPATRADCIDGPRPCPYVSCRHHLWLRLQQEQPGNPQQGRQGATTMRPATMETCSLDVADRGKQTFDQIGELLGVHPTRARQIYEAALLKLYAQGVDIDELERALEDK